MAQIDKTTETKLIKFKDGSFELNAKTDLVRTKSKQVYVSAWFDDEGNLKDTAIFAFSKGVILAC